MQRPIAIVGISVELPSGAYSKSNLDHDSFFEFLMNSGQAYEQIPTTRFHSGTWKGNGVGQIRVHNGSFLKDIDVFDHIEFGISSRDALAMAPATKKLLEQCFLALLDSGIDYRKQDVGCITSANIFEGPKDEYESRGSFAWVPSMVANRISTHLDLLGPSVPVDTACSSTQTAFHLAVQSILVGDCKAAVVGGCQLNFGRSEWMWYSQSEVLSADGQCKPFDALADGFGRAEGCAAVVIKPLENALRDHDRIYATVLGTSSNSSGSGGPPGAPVAEAQQQAMKLAFERAGKLPREVAYVEVHATGTAKGDPTEANWVGEHFNRSDELLLGSMKGNIGHTEITAFLASMSKVLSIFEHNMIPPNVNLSTPNPAIKWREYNLHVPTTPTPLPSPKASSGLGRALISMSSSGIGGSNGHVVLEAPPEPLPAPRVVRGVDQPVLFMASGLSPRSASAVADQLSVVLSTVSADEYPALSTVLSRRARQMNWRSYALAKPGAPVKFSKPDYCAREVNRIVLVFSGQGPQHELMGRELFATFPAFRDSILDMDAVFTRVTGKSVIHDFGLFGSCTSAISTLPSVWPISLTLPAIAMFQMALFDLLLHLGIRPDIVLGHSAGETAVLYASGAAPKAMALELAIIRGQVFSALETGSGTMAALACGPEIAEQFLAQLDTLNPDAVVEIACLNSPTAVAISGNEKAIDLAVALARKKDVFARKIRTRIPMHSSMMDVCREEYRAEVQALFERYPGPHVPNITTYSTHSGAPFAQSFGAEYFWASTRSQVLFTPVIQRLAQSSTFVEISPHPVLSSYLSEMMDSSSTVLPTVRRPKPGGPCAEYTDILTFLGQLTSVGHNGVDFTILNGAVSSDSKVKLSPYPFLKRPFALYPEATRELESQHHGPVNRSRLRLNKDTHPTMAEHVIRGESIWPAAGFIEMALEFGATTLFDVHLRSLLSLSTDTPLLVNVSLDGSYWKVTSRVPGRSGRDSGDGNLERLHADGYLSFEAPPVYEDLDIPSIRQRCTLHVSDSDFYHSLSYFSSYGPTFQRITNVYYNSDEALASIRATDGSFAGECPYIIHPAILDGCFQIAAYRPFRGDYAPNYYYLPYRIKEFILHRPAKAGYLPPHVYAHVVLSRWMPESIQYIATIVDDFGTRFCTIEFTASRHQLAPLDGIASPLHVALRPFVHDDGSPVHGDILSCSDHECAKESPLFRAKDIVVDYKIGEEAQLQWYLGGLNSSQALNVYILTTEGLDAAAGLGLARALRREKLHWNIRLVSFPGAFSDDERKRYLSAVPSCIRDEPDIIFSLEGECLVPRLVPLFTEAPQWTSIVGEVRTHCASAVISDASSHSHFTAVVGTLERVASDDSAYRAGSTVAGIQFRLVGEKPIINLASACLLPPEQHADAEAIPALAIAVLASPQSHSCTVLVTHADTVIGSTLCKIYTRDGFDVMQAPENVPMLDLGRMEPSKFDLIVSGYDDPVHPPVLRRLLRASTGRLFLWNQALVELLRDDSARIGDALRMAIDRGYLELYPNPSRSLSAVNANDPIVPSRDPSLGPFDRQKAYIILGGIGSLGAHIAMYLVQNGARHIILTSRSGEASLKKKDNLFVRHIITYLRSIPSLSIRLEAVDAASPEAMRHLFDSITTDRTVGGCFILTAVTADGLFSTLREEDFTTVFASKIGVVDALRHSTDTSAIEFIAAFSSLTSVVGSGGQTNYCAANAALEEQMLDFPNGFAFVCPGILDSAIIQNGMSHLKQMMGWTISAQELILWLDDAVTRHLNGERFQRYIPSVNWGVMNEALGMPKLGLHLVPPPDGKDVQTGDEPVEVTAGRIIQKVLRVAEEDFDPDVPLTAYGIDSLSAGRLSFSLQPLLPVSQIQLMADNSLSDIMSKFGQPSSVEPAVVEDKAARNADASFTDKMRSHVHQYAKRLDGLLISPLDECHSSCSKHTVLITGTTGTLGCYILSQLLVRDNIDHVYAINRANEVPLLDRQSAALRKQGLSAVLAASPKLTLISGDLQREDLGISPQVMNQLLSSVTQIIHNAWKVDFLASLSDFESLILGTHRLLEVAMNSKYPTRPSFSFISTISVCWNVAGAEHGPEAPLLEPSTPAMSGYLASKWIAERCVQMASERRLLNTNVIRVGLVTGGPDGTWDTAQWFPGLVLSSTEIGCLPDGDDMIHWIPIADAAAAIVDMQACMNETLHVNHPTPTTWRTVMQPLAQVLRLPLVPYPEWFARLKAAAEFATRATGALGLLGYFEFGLHPTASKESMGLIAKVSVEKGTRSSASLAKIRSLGPQDVEKWVQRWREMGYLS